MPHILGVADRGNVISIYFGLATVQSKVTAAPVRCDDADETPSKKVKVSSKKPVKKEKIKEEFDKDNVGAFILPPTSLHPTANNDGGSALYAEHRELRGIPEAGFIVSHSCKVLS